ncbi:MAG: shikimate dehydrogenase family protein, partial [Deltaproteobacteria bacterium]
MTSRNTEFISKETQLYVSFAELPGNAGTVWFNKMFTHHNINAVYKAFQIDRSDFGKAWDGVKSLKIAGGAISMPFKRQAAQLVDEVRGIAQRIGTINTFRRDEHGKYEGFNTDYIAALRALPDRASSVYMLGAGGVAAAIALATQEKNLPSFKVVSRNRENICIPGGVNFEWESWDQLPYLPGPEVLVNCTPLGMVPTAELQIPVSWWGNLKLAIDLTYRPEGNAFSVLCKQKGIPLIDGKMFSR